MSFSTKIYEYVGFERLAEKEKKNLCPYISDCKASPWLQFGNFNGVGKIVQVDHLRNRHTCGYCNDTTEGSDEYISLHRKICKAYLFLQMIEQTDSNIKSTWRERHDRLPTALQRNKYYYDDQEPLPKKRIFVLKKETKSGKRTYTILPAKTKVMELTSPTQLSEMQQLQQMDVSAFVVAPS